MNIDNNDNNPEPGTVNDMAEHGEELPTHGQWEEHPIKNEEELTLNNRDENQLASSNERGTPMVPNDPTLPPRAQRC